MDEQNPGVTGKRSRGVEGTGLDRPKRGMPSGGSTLTPDRPAAPPSRAGAAISDDPEIRTHEIRAEIEQTREDMSETVNAIQERLRPGAIASNAADKVKRVARDTVRDVADSDSVTYVRANPIATAMIGIGVAGLAWLVMRGGDGHSSRGSYRRESSSKSPGLADSSVLRGQRFLPVRRRPLPRRLAQSATRAVGLARRRHRRLFPEATAAHVERDSTADWRGSGGSRGDRRSHDSGNRARERADGRNPRQHARHCSGNRTRQSNRGAAGGDQRRVPGPRRGEECGRPG